MTLARETLIALAARDVLLTTGVTTQDTVMAGHPILVGDQSFWATNPDRFRRSQLLQINDGSGEEYLPITDDWTSDAGNPIPINWTGMDYAGFRYAHAAGAPIGTHLYEDAPADNAVSTSQGDPVVWVQVSQETGGWAAIPLTIESAYVFMLNYRLTLVQDRAIGQDGAVMNPTTWVMRVRRKAHEDVQVLVDALLQNEDLNGTTDGEAVLGMGTRGDPQGTAYTKNWGEVTVGTTADGSLQIGAQVTIPLRGDWLDYFE